jgi:hypothetical protein
MRVAMSAWESQREPMLRPFDSAAGAGVDARALLVRQALAAAADVRLSEREHALIPSLRDDLMARIEDELRERVCAAIDRHAHPALAASLETKRVRIATPILARAGIACGDEIVPILLRRIDEDRLTRRITALRDPADPAEDPLMDDGDRTVADAAAALLVAAMRRFDRFGEPRIDIADLAAGTRSRIVWELAAALAHHARTHHGVATDLADRLMNDAAVDLLAADPGVTADAAAESLAGLLDSRARLDDRITAEALGAGQVAFFVAAVARCAGLPVEHCWRVIAGVPADLPMLLRAAEMSRESGAHALALLSDDAARAIEEFDAIDDTAAAEALRLWRLDPVYRGALRTIERAP